MPLTGELEQLPIVDVIQLIHSTRKSGVLTVYSRKGEGQLIFNNGYIVSAIHSSDDLKIGQILLEKDIISEDELNQALASQNASNDNHQPLIAILHEQCEISKDDAYNALETLIELTLVEMISWTRGVFTLDTEQEVISDDYKFLPNDLQNINLDTQMVLMDALRIFDEKVHAGEIEISDEPFEGEIPGLTPAGMTKTEATGGEIELSDDILGLAELDKIERKKPKAFEVIDTFDPFDIHRESIVQALPAITDQEQKKLVSFLSESSHLDGKMAPLNSSSQAVILYSADQFLQHAIMTVCKREGLMIFTPPSYQDLESNITRSILKGYEPIIVCGCPDETNPEFTNENISKSRSNVLHMYPEVPLIQLANPADYHFGLNALNAGCRAVFPYPSGPGRETVVADDLVQFLKTLINYIQGMYSDEIHAQYSLFKRYLDKMASATKAPDLSLLVLKFVSEFFSRALTLVVDRNSLIAERSIGIVSNNSRNVAPPLKNRISIQNNSIFDHTLASEECFWGGNEDMMFTEILYPVIGAPSEPSCFILPLKTRDRVVTMTYADFGTKNASHPPLDLLKIFARQAGFAMENALVRKVTSRAGNPL